MRTRKLGKSGIKVSALGLGCAGIGGPFLNQEGGVNGYGQVDDKKSIEAIQVALNLGINFFDTADVYGCGRSEMVLGEALGSQRDDVFIASKFGNTWNISSNNSLIPCHATGIDTTPEAIRNSCFGSLKRLNTDYIDLFQLHLGNLPVSKAAPIMDTLDELSDEGLIRYYGWSTNKPERANAFANRKRFIAVQFRHNLISRNNHMIVSVVKKFDVGGIIKGPLGYGLFTGKYEKIRNLPIDHVWHGTNFSLGKVGRILSLLKEAEPILTSDGRTLSQGAIAWIWSQGNELIPIPGFKTVQQVKENIQAMNFGPLKRRHIDELERILEKRSDPWL